MIKGAHGGGSLAVGQSAEMSGHPVWSATCLVSSTNANGTSYMIGYDRYGGTIEHQESVPISRCLVNVGEGTQRFCSERRIKLSTISCIVVTSLAPHNLSGFSGVFLSLSDLGVGKLTVIGPCGLQSCLDIMLPIINRKYPVLEVVEVDRDTPPERLTTVTDHWVVRAYPIFPNESCNKVLAIAADIISADAWTASRSPGSVHSSSRSAMVCTTFPVPFYFEPTPSLEDVVEQGGAALRSRLGAFQRAFLFSRLGVVSFDSSSISGCAANASEQICRLRRLCEAHDACGMVDTGNLSDDTIETRYSQVMLGVLHRLCRPLFPDAAPPVRALRDAALSGADENNDNHSAGSEGTESGRLSLAAPMLRLLEWEAATHPEGRWEATDSVRATAKKGAERIRLCEEAVLSHLPQLLHPAKPCHHRVSSAPIPLMPLPPPTPPPPPQPPVLVRNFTFNGSGTEASISAYPSMPPPSFPPSWSGLTLSSSSASVDPAGNSRASSLLGAPLSVSSSDVSESATPTRSPGTNFTAASLIRSNLLQKRKLHVSDTNLPPVHSAGSTPKGLPSPLLPGNTQTGEPDPDDCTPRTSPLKSLRLSDSARQPIFFPENMPNSPQYAIPPTPITLPTNGAAQEPLHKGIAEDQKSDSESGSFTDVQAAPMPVHLRNPMSSQPAGSDDTELSAFLIPPPNPGTDICTVTFLGTGSAKPSKFRNGSCIMLSLNAPHVESFGHEPFGPAGRLAIDTRDAAAGDGTQAAPSGPAPRRQIVLLDVGEGTAAQMFQSVGCDTARFDELLLSIKLIWISHHHADHMTGVPMLLEQIKRARLRREGQGDGESGKGFRNSIRRVPTVSKYDMRSMFASGGYEPGKVMVIGSEAVLKYFEFTACVAGLDDLVTFSPIVKTLYAGETKEIAAATEGIITRLRSIPVQHCQGSYGLVLDFKSTHKVVYSGDCRPSQSLVKAGLDCDLLIHEATFDESMYDDAVKKRHSTSAEARRVAAQMRARHTVLTHFSQRYPLEASTSTSAGLASASTGMPHSRSTGDLAQIALNNGREYSLPRPAVAYDFLRFSFPSQAADLPRATEAVGVVLAELEAQRKARSHHQT